VRLLVQVICLRVQFLNYSIKSIYLDNVREYSSRAFNTYCISIGIIIKHSITYRECLIEPFIKMLQLIVKSLLMRTNLTASVWGHTISH
jgi:hypothetical protein